MMLLRDHGTLRLRDVLEYAIGYAGAGSRPLPRIGGGDRRRGASCSATDWPTSAEI